MNKEETNIFHLLDWYITFTELTISYDNLCQDGFI